MKPCVNCGKSVGGSSLFDSQKRLWCSVCIREKLDVAEPKVRHLNTNSAFRQVIRDNLLKLPDAWDQLRDTCLAMADDCDELEKRAAEAAGANSPKNPVLQSLPEFFKEHPRWRLKAKQDMVFITASTEHQIVIATSGGAVHTCDRETFFKAYEEVNP